MEEMKRKGTNVGKRKGKEGGFLQEMCDSGNLDVGYCLLPLRDLDKLSLNPKVAENFPLDIREPHTLLVQASLCCGVSVPQDADSTWCTVANKKFSHKQIAPLQ